MAKKEAFLRRKVKNILINIIWGWPPFGTHYWGRVEGVDRTQYAKGRYSKSLLFRIQQKHYKVAFYR